MSNLLCAGVLELDTNGDLLLVANHPSLDAVELEVIKSRSGLVQGKAASITPFVCSRFGNHWQYIVVCGSDSDTRINLPFVDRFAVFVTAKDFCPEKYTALCNVIATAHAKTGNSVHLMRVFVDVTIRKKFDSKELGVSFAESSFDPRRSLLASPLKGIVETFGEQVGVLWVGMLLKRRIFVVAPSPQDALKYVRAMPLLVWHRASWGVLRPLVTPTDHDVKDLEQAGIFCAGVVGQDNPLPRKVNHDLVVLLSEQRVVASDSGKVLLDYTQLPMIQNVVTKLIAEAETQNDQAVIKLLATHTKEVVDKVSALKREVASSGGEFSIEVLTGAPHSLPPRMAQFVYAVALAEGLL